uniref:Uncharacterized protein n=1 Tax=Panagrolaimus davidi TaxID=227884 RepID=A0A914QBX3_9BILA
MPKKEKKPKTPETTTAEDVPENKNKKKTKTLESKTIEDAPAPTVSKQEPPTQASKEPAPTEHQPTPTPPTAFYPQVKRLIPRGMKSAKTDSLDETLKKDKSAMVESFIVSAEKLCLKTDESDVFDEIKANYPNIQHEVLASEIKLLCLPVSQMYEEMNTLVHDSVNKLCAAGYRFDQHRQIVTALKGAHQFLKDPTTDATTPLFGHINKTETIAMQEAQMSRAEDFKNSEMISAAYPTTRKFKLRVCVTQE